MLTHDQSEPRVWGPRGLGVRVWGLEFRVWGSGFRCGAVEWWNCWELASSLESTNPMAKHDQLRA